ncbi:hypothetical protein ACFY3U_12410 [Micromonospora sp. NPDC000089]|uniref:hypothetical protein n=1 Tax=unclassified Micromonospora TaxID=2617518 RepID=UPI0036A1B55B
MTDRHLPRRTLLRALALGAVAAPAALAAPATAAPSTTATPDRSDRPTPATRAAVPARPTHAHLIGVL